MLYDGEWWLDKERFEMKLIDIPLEEIWNEE